MVEYKIIIVMEGLQALENKLNLLGGCRWDCYHIEYRDEGLLGTYIAFLKRP